MTIKILMLALRQESLKKRHKSKTIIYLSFSQ